MAIAFSSGRDLLLEGLEIGSDVSLGVASVACCVIRLRLARFDFESLDV